MPPRPSMVSPFSEDRFTRPSADAPSSEATQAPLKSAEPVSGQGGPAWCGRRNLRAFQSFEGNGASLTPDLDFTGQYESD